VKESGLGVVAFYQLVLADSSLRLHLLVSDACTKIEASSKSEKLRHEKFHDSS
jgi:hypothetical protein